MPRVVGRSSGTLFQLDPAAEIGRGAEGVVYRAGDAAVKVYTAGLDVLAADKIDALIRFTTTVPDVAWPVELVHDSAGRPVGYVMPLATGRSLEALTDARETGAMPAAGKAAVAACLAAAVAAAHAAPALSMALGDTLKAGNVIIDDRRATLVDAAAVSLFGFRGGNGRLIDAVETTVTPGYRPAEALAHPAAKPSRAADLFALGVVLFELIFGRPPTEPRPCAAAVGLDPDDAVRRGLFVRYAAHPDFRAPAYDPIAVPPDVDDLFRAAFLGAPHQRPTAAEWVARLTAWRDALAAPRPARTAPVRRWLSRAARFARRHEAVAAAVIAVSSAVLIGRWAALDGAAAWRRLFPPPKAAPAPPPPDKRVGPPVFQEIFR